MRTTPVPMIKVLAVICLAMAGMVACTQPAPSDGDLVGVGYAEPGWMAEVRQDDEQYMSELAACLKKDGWEIVVNPDGSYEPVGPLSKDQKKAYRSAGSVCVNELFGPSVPLTEDEWRMRYSRALDTRDCLEAQGYEVSDPPSEDVWVEQGLVAGSPRWVPFQEVINEVISGTLEMDETSYYSLATTCTQGGPTAVMGW